MRENKHSYFGAIFWGLKSLLTGLGVTFKEFFTGKVTQQYPENRDTLYIPERFRGTLIMPHDEEGRNKCTACLLCQQNCPNGTLDLKIDTIIIPETGKKKKVMVNYQYNLGSCMFCHLCVNVCSTNAIAFENSFEHAVFDREKLILTLNRPDPDYIAFKDYKPESEPAAGTGEKNTNSTNTDAK
jgi:NADH-quinone oxidoreductase subunit I